jgi:hypothetical protein
LEDLTFVEKTLETLYNYNLIVDFDRISEDSPNENANLVWMAASKRRDAASGGGGGRLIFNLGVNLRIAP